MKVSVCITVLNEEKNISDLLMSLLTQSKKPDEIVIVDGGSTDKTVSIIEHYRKKHINIRLSISRVSRAKGRNIAVNESRYDVIAVTDGGCIPSHNWIKQIVSPFESDEVQVVAGFYNMKADTPMQKAFSVFLGILPGKFTSDYLPSARSLAFRRNIFDKVGGFPEKMTDTAEDSLFAINIIRMGVKMIRVKNAKVDWEMPTNYLAGIRKFYNYALGDARSGIWTHPVNGLWSHNMKALFIFFRYVFFSTTLFLCFFYFPAIIIFALVLSTYFVRAFLKVYTVYKNIKAGLWGVIIQISSDIFVMAGFLRGIMRL